MRYVTQDGIELHGWEEGAGEPVVLVHGSWVDHRDWDAVAPLLADHFLVVRHNRRGYGGGGRPVGARSRRQDEDDLAALIGAVGRGPAHVVGNSFGASVALGLARRRPDLLRSLCVHEPPLLGAASQDARLRPLLDEVRGRIGAVVAQLRAGDHEGGARRFVEEIALGPGAWQALPEEVRHLVAGNAPGFLGDVEDPGWADLPLDGASDPGCPVLVTWGSESPAWLWEVAALVSERIPGARGRMLAGCGHLPHLTHPPQYAAAVGTFIEQAHPLVGSRRDD
jgi:pimeloyl-ACP methyl ester carboxylesterase